MACADYTVDMKAHAFGQCVCGRAKGDHSLAYRRRSSSSGGARRKSSGSSGRTVRSSEPGTPRRSSAVGSARAQPPSAEVARSASLERRRGEKAEPEAAAREGGTQKEAGGAAVGSPLRVSRRRSSSTEEMQRARKPSVDQMMASAVAGGFNFSPNAAGPGRTGGAVAAAGEATERLLELLDGAGSPWAVGGAGFRSLPEVRRSVCSAAYIVRCAPSTSRQH